MAPRVAPDTRRRVGTGGRRRACAFLAGRSSHGRRLPRYPYAQTLVERPARVCAPVIDLAPHGFQLLGARLDYLNDRAVAAVVYRRRQHRINLWIAPAGPATATAAVLATHHGYHVLHWVHAGMAYWAVSDLNQQELSLLKQLLQDP